MSGVVMKKRNMVNQARLLLISQFQFKVSQEDKQYKQQHRRICQQLFQVPENYIFGQWNLLQASLYLSHWKCHSPSRLIQCKSAVGMDLLLASQIMAKHLHLVNKIKKGSQDKEIITQDCCQLLLKIWQILTRKLQVFLVVTGMQLSKHTPIIYILGVAIQMDNLVLEI